VIAKRRKLMGLAGILFAIISLLNLVSCFVPYLSYELSWFINITAIGTPLMSGFFAFAVFLYARALSHQKP